MNASATNLSSGGSTRLEFNVVNASAGNSLYNSVETSVTISSLCQNAVFDTPITTTSGSFSTTYEAGCAGTDTITARLPNGSTATANVNVAAPEIGELEFLTVTPDSIALSGSSTSGRPSVSDVTFQLNDKNGNPITTGEGIAFTLSTTVGGISLSQASTETDENGVASTRVNAGTVATVVSVTATYTPDTGPVIQTTSAPISISATIPDQDSFSLSVEENFLPNARNYDGVSVPITIRAADRNNNRISDAVVNFVTNSGSVQSECILQDGACSIEWISQNPRADDGVALILARTVGEESFRDLNSDGK
ncbi:Ig-like domain-containing protein, partial [Pseudoalteromonas sp. GABNS16H]